MRFKLRYPIISNRESLQYTHYIYHIRNFFLHATWRVFLSDNNSNTNTCFRSVYCMCSYALNHHIVKNTLKCVIYAMKLHLNQNALLLLLRVPLCRKFQQSFSEACDRNPETAFYDLIFDHILSPPINMFIGLYSRYHRGVRCYSHLNFFNGNTFICSW